MDKISLQEANPELAKQWHPTKNGDLIPKDVARGSHKKVWWICSHGHSWEATINSRNNGGNNCSYCSGRYACNDNCLATLNHNLAKQWHPTKNGDLTPRDFTTGSNNNVWWVCDKGHEWKATIYSRNKGSGCPYCSRKAVCNDNCLATLNPDLAKQWNQSKNGSLTTKDVTTGSNKKVWWICNKGHEWQASLSNRSRGDGCPYCSGQAVCIDNCLLTLNPELAGEWHPTRNSSLTPRDVTVGSSRQKVWWMCGKGHEWQATVLNRNNGSGCPYCSGNAVCEDNCLATLNPELAKQWNHVKNGDLTPKDVTMGSNTKAWWKCEKGHEWRSTVHSRGRGLGCPYCSGKAVCDDNCLATLVPDIAKQWHPTKNGGLTPKDVTVGSGKRVWWICNKGHEWQTTVGSRGIRGDGCPKCYPQISQLELRIYCELKYLFPSTTSKEKISGKECDVYIPEIKTGVEVDGVYWHRSKYLKDKKKSDEIRSKGITLINVRQAGLERISEADIFHTPEDSALTVIKKILSTIDEQCSLSSDKREAIDQYLRGQKFANDSEYKKLWDLLPSPFPGSSLADLRPELIKDWHDDKNGSLLPKDVSPFSSIKVWWICDKGHEWEATVSTRSAGHGCPYCWGTTVCEDNCLATLNPRLAKQWHPTKNGRLTPSDVTAGSNRKAWWLCDKGHEWYANILNRNNGIGCPYCSGKAACSDNCLATLNPELANQWHPTKNGNLTSKDVTLHSAKKVWWVCNKGHEWEAAVYWRSNGNGCPYCSGNKVCDDNCLATMNPELAKQWHPTKNGSLTPRDITRGSHTKAWWLCEKGHEYQAMVKDRYKGHGCPYCCGKVARADNCLATLNSDLAKQWHPTKNGGLTPKDVTVGSNRKVWWLCDKGHKWQAIIYHRNNGSGCPKCRSLKKSQSA